MAAVGLIPDKKMMDEPSTRKHMATLVEFVFAMRDKLKDINDNSYNNFMLRVGKTAMLSYYTIALSLRFFEISR